MSQEVYEAEGVTFTRMIGEEVEPHIQVTAGASFVQVPLAVFMRGAKEVEAYDAAGGTATGRPPEAPAERPPCPKCGKQPQDFYGGGPCCNGSCNGTWGTGCYHCHSAHFWVEPSLAKPRKDDAGKPNMRLLPWAALRAVADVMHWAITDKPKPYPEGNWKGVAPERYESAALRHIAAHIEGEQNDPESGMSHLAHASFCTLVMLWQQVQAADRSS